MIKIADLEEAVLLGTGDRVIDEALAALLRLARAAKAEDTQRTRILAGELKFPRDDDQCSVTLRELYLALGAFDFTPKTDDESCCMAWIDRDSGPVCGKPKGHDGRHVGFYYGVKQSWLDSDREPVHDSSTACWCGPELDYVDPDTGCEVWMHKRLQ